MTNHYTKLHPLLRPDQTANALVCFQVSEFLIYGIMFDLSERGTQDICRHLKNHIFTAVMRSLEVRQGDWIEDEFPYIGGDESPEWV